MSRARRQDTAPELDLRRVLHSRGLRYRVHRPLPSDRRRKIDIAFVREKVAVFVDGCFWHACPQHGTMPVSNNEFWREKLAKNRRRDGETTALLTEAGWSVVRVWEHEDPVEAADRVETLVLRRRSLSNATFPE
jgi:DNA mismatch endonuclease, patch repair protein